MELEATGLLMQEAYMDGTIIVDVCNGFNNMIRLVLMRMVRHRSLDTAHFVFNCYKHWEQLLLLWPGILLFTLISLEVLYNITLIPMAKELQTDVPPLLALFYVEDAAFYGLARRITQLLQLLMDQGMNWGYFLDTENSMFISAPPPPPPAQEEAEQRAFLEEELEIIFVSGSQ